MIAALETRHRFQLFRRNWIKFQFGLTEWEEAANQLRTNQTNTSGFIPALFHFILIQEIESNWMKLKPGRKKEEAGRREKEWS